MTRKDDMKNTAWARAGAAAVAAAPVRVVTRVPMSETRRNETERCRVAIGV